MTLKESELILNEELILSPSIIVFDSTDLDIDGDTLKVLSPIPKNLHRLLENKS